MSLPFSIEQDGTITYEGYRVGWVDKNAAPGMLERLAVWLNADLPPPNLMKTPREACEGLSATVPETKST